MNHRFLNRCTLLIVVYPIAHTRCDPQMGILCAFATRSHPQTLPNIWSLCRNHDCLGVGRIVLLPLHERFDIAWRNQFHLVPQPDHLPRPEVGATASFHGDDRRGLSGYEHEKLRPSAFSGTSLRRSSTLREPGKHSLPNPHQSSYLFSWVPSFHPSGCNATILAHCDAVEGGRQPPHLQSGPQPLNATQFQTQPRCRSC